MRSPARPARIIGVISTFYHFSGMFVNPSSLIKILLRIGGPFAVFFRIIPVIIYTFYSGISSGVRFLVKGIVFVHIISKLLQGTPKTLNSSSTVPSIISNTRKVTAVLHRFINLIECGIRRTMSSKLCPPYFFPVTSTGFCSNNIHATYYTRIPTRTRTKQLTAFKFFYNRQLPENLTNMLIFHIATKGIDRLVSSLSPSHTRLIMQTS